MVLVMKVFVLPNNVMGGTESYSSPPSAGMCKTEGFQKKIWPTFRKSMRFGRFRTFSILPAML
jgi:hypothetical protein